MVFKVVRAAALSTQALLCASLVACEPADEIPPPATAQQAAAVQGGAPSAGAGGAGDSSDYASGEYTIGADTDTYDDHDPAALHDFRATLDPYGSWVDDTTYGTVWVPSRAIVGGDFVPYSTAGHWVYDDDWIWVSDYPWGWAPFHYGRWVFVGGRGWAWIPGRVYSGAWVAWGVDDGYTYVGWYPLGPSFVWFGGVAVAYPVYVGPRWVYCPRAVVFAPNVGARVVAAPSAGPVANNVRPYVPATPGVAAGPPPQRLGFTAAQIPHATGTAATSLQQARSFARPSTAQPIGGSQATRVTTPLASAPASQWSSRPSLTSSPVSVPHGTQAPTSVRPSSPSVSQPMNRAPAAPVYQPRSSAPATHFSGGGSFGGGHHR
jgi:hypothetical protein